MNTRRKNNYLKKIVQAFNGKCTCVSTFRVSALGTQTFIHNAFLEVSDGELCIESESSRTWCRVNSDAIENIIKCRENYFKVFLKDAQVCIEEYHY
jgi:hypothetical protein